ncbi:Aste57867_14311 [Aphanomyces stellatus]|uniref:Probable RNA polymerase II nuclear localization protein SLC7A6OS n=1 Tax=Aphanomyces stellatus TaxID=120398 RepID=A0A485L2S2_9STRA|nr:hypothetical protein As57867_014258 [Aphanomyces stellatus]VFT91136.1 Aste57867_14311 [Aphanomyces stellatus]
MSGKVLLRIKRKSTEDPVEHLVVHGQHALSKKAKLEDALGSLTLTSDECPSTAQTSLFVFTRIDTVASSTDEKQVHRRLAKSVRRHRMDSFKKTIPSGAQEASKDIHRNQQKQKRCVIIFVILTNISSVYRTQRILQGRGLSLVDVIIPRESPDATLTLNDQPLTSRPANRVLNPMQRNVDESIWLAFQRNDFSMFFRVKHEVPSALGFQRPADGGTILMAAAMHNRTDVIEKLLVLDSTCVALKDWNEKSAADIALSQGHVAAATALRACESMESEKEFVYDVYSIDIDATHASATTPMNNAPVVSVTSSVEKWLAHEAFGDLDSEDRDLVFDVDSDGSDNDALEDDEDSNDEDHAGNDYPDEEEESDGEHSEASRLSWDEDEHRNAHNPWSKQEFDCEGDY